MDNAGGHGTKECVDKYVEMLQDEHNIIVIHQCPRSPETNILDLGVWRAFQHVVEKQHFRKRKEKGALWRTCQGAYKTLDPQKLTNVYNRWLYVLDLIITDDGDNRLVESRRGKLFSAPPAEWESLDNHGSDADDESSEEVMLTAAEEDTIADLEADMVW